MRKSDQIKSAASRLSGMSMSFWRLGSQFGTFGQQTLATFNRPR
jgi:hypothetical protein